MDRRPVFASLLSAPIPLYFAVCCRGLVACKIFPRLSCQLDSGYVLPWIGTGTRADRRKGRSGFLLPCGFRYTFCQQYRGQYNRGYRNGGYKSGSGNSCCPNQGDNSGRSRTNRDSISNASIAIVSCSHSPAIIAALTSGYHAFLLIALPGPSFCFWLSGSSSIFVPNPLH